MLSLRKLINKFLNLLDFDEKSVVWRTTQILRLFVYPNNQMVANWFLSLRQQNNYSMDKWMNHVLLILGVTLKVLPFHEKKTQKNFVREKNLWLTFTSIWIVKTPPFFALHSLTLSCLNKHWESNRKESAKQQVLRDVYLFIGGKNYTKNCTSMRKTRGCFLEPLLKIPWSNFVKKQ